MDLVDTKGEHLLDPAMAGAAVTLPAVTVELDELSPERCGTEAGVNRCLRKRMDAVHVTVVDAHGPAGGRHVLVPAGCPTVLLEAAVHEVGAARRGSQKHQTKSQDRQDSRIDAALHTVLRTDRRPGQRG